MPFRTSTQARAAAHSSWAKTADRSERTRPAREAALASFEAQVDPARVMSPRDRRKAAINAQKARMNSMSQKGVDARRAKAKAKRRSGADPPDAAAPEDDPGPTNATDDAEPDSAMSRRQGGRR